MKLRLYLLLFSIICLAPCYVLGQEKGDHLEPVEDVFNLYDWQAEYFSDIKKLLFTQGLSQARIRILSKPAFGKERSIEVFWDRSENSGQIIRRVPEERIWKHEHPENIIVNELNRVIDRSNYILLYELFLNAVKDTRYQQGRWIGLDGYTVYFMVWDAGWKSGQTWAPKEGTKMKQLVDIYFELSKQLEVEKRDFIISDSLAKQIETLKEQF